MKTPNSLTNKLTTLVAVLFVIITLVSCSASGKFKAYLNEGAIPADLKKDGYVLLVLKQDVGAFRGVQNRGVNKMMRRHYGAAYEMVSAEDLKDPKYSNTDKYRYLIGRDFSSGTVVTTTSSMGTSGGIQTTHREYHEETIFDRKNNTAFPSLGYPSASYSLGMKGFSKYMKKH